MKEVRASMFLESEIHIEELFDGGDHFTIVYNRTGSVGDEDAGYEVSEHSFEHPGMMTCRVEDDLVTDTWGVQDHGQRLADVGILPEP